MGLRIRRAIIKTKQGRRLSCFYVNEIDSTNEFAKKALKQGNVQDIAAFIAKTQTEGHGRYGRVFYSPKGGLYLTYVQSVGEKDCSALGCYCALAVLDTLATLGIEGRREVSLKWPNDVKVNGKKICGILPETVVYNGVRYLLIGVGLNLNTPLESLQELLPNATSVLEETGRKNRRIKVAKMLAKNLNEIVSAYLVCVGKEGYGAKEEMHDRYLKYCESVGLSVSYKKNEQEKIGVVETVDINGSLIMHDGEKIGWGEISYIE